MAALAAGFGALLLVLALLAASAGGALSALTGGSGSRPSRIALTDIPPTYLALYQRAARTCPGLDWTVLAAIGKIESNHGRSTLRGVRSGANSAGAKGPMQFLQPTFDDVIADHPALRKSKPLSPYDPADAIPAAAAYLCDNGARNRRNLRSAIWTYNNANWYVTDVLAQADHYRTTTSQPPAPAAHQALDYAKGQLGLPTMGRQRPRQRRQRL